MRVIADQTVQMRTSATRRSVIEPPVDHAEHEPELGERLTVGSKVVGEAVEQRVPSVGGGTLAVGGRNGWIAS